MKSDQRADILHRLHCAAGHLNAVIEITEADQPCEQVLHQLKAVEAALHIVAAKLIMYQAKSIQAAILKSSSPQECMVELSHLQALYATFIQHADHSSEVIND